MKSSVLGLAAVLCVVSSQQVINVNTVPWWRRAIFYQVYPRSFRDSNGDGVGDLKGIAEKAQYFKDLGVDAIWISPFYPSPMRDFGYDVSDYKGVDPMFGTMDDFRQLTATLEKLGVKLVIDFVPNHTSDLHPWFQLSCNKTGNYTDYYVWDDGIPNPANKSRPFPPNNWMSVFGGSAWEWHEGRKQFYYHAFLPQQPDLNFNNNETRAAMEDVIRYWLDIGVDGFRLDSANYMFESDNRTENETVIPNTDPTQWKNYVHNLTQNQNKTYQLFNDWASIFYNYSTKSKPRALFLEVYTDLNLTLKYYGKGNNSLMLPFNFELLVHANQSSRSPWIKELIDDWLNGMPDDGVANWVVGNHDNGRVADRYGFEMVDVINLLTGVLPGIKVTYYGAEIGMRDTFVRFDQTVDPSGKNLGPYHYMEASRDPERTPMQWDNTVSAGFSSNKTTWLPVNPNYWWLNVAEQKAAASSHLKVFQALAKARRDPVLLAGNCSVKTPDNDTLIIVRSLNSSSYSSYFVLLINMGSEMRTYTNTSWLWPDSTHNQTLFDIQINITTMDVDAHKPGERMSANSFNLTLRPKGAILFRSVPASPSAVGLPLLSLPLLAFTILVNFYR